MTEAHDIEQHLPAQQRPHAHGSQRRYVEEDRAWSQLYTAIGHPSTAEEVVKQLEADPQAKRTHLALYIRAKTTLREQKAVDARNQRIGSFVRWVLTSVVLGPFRWLRAARSVAAGVAIEALPPVRREPSRTRATALRGDPDFAPAKERFAGTAAGAGATAEVEGSRGAKAA